MPFTDLQYLLIETDDQIRFLSRRFEAGDEIALYELITLLQRAGREKEIAEYVTVDNFDMLYQNNLLSPRVIKLVSQNWARTQLAPEDVQASKDFPEEFVKYVYRKLRSADKRFSADTRGSTMAFLEPYLPYFAQDYRAALGSARLFKFIWEEVESGPIDLTRIAKSEIAKDPQSAFEYFNHFGQIRPSSTRAEWPWKFNDPLGRTVLNLFASRSDWALAYAQVSSRIDPKMPPWPANDEIGLKALMRIAKNDKTLTAYLDLPQGTHIWKTPARPIAERTYGNP